MVLVGDTQCHAPLAQRYLQAGRMIGNEAGLFLHQQTRTGPRDSPAAPDLPAAPAEPRRLNRKLGPFTNDRCFHVTLDGPKHYHFVIDDVEYPRALGNVQVAILVHAVDMGELEPRPNRLALLRRLEFHADGDASGAFEVTLFLVDSEGHESQPFRIDQPCGPA